MREYLILRLNLKHGPKLKQEKYSPEFVARGLELQFPEGAQSEHFRNSKEIYFQVHLAHRYATIRRNTSCW